MRHISKTEKDNRLLKWIFGKLKRLSFSNMLSNLSYRASLIAQIKFENFWFLQQF